MLLLIILRLLSMFVCFFQHSSFAPIIIMTAARALSVECKQMAYGKHFAALEDSVITQNH